MVDRVSGIVGARSSRALAGASVAVMLSASGIVLAGPSAATTTAKDAQTVSDSSAAFTATCTRTSGNRDLKVRLFIEKVGNNLSSVTVHATDNTAGGSLRNRHVNVRGVKVSAKGSKGTTTRSAGSTPHTFEFTPSGAGKNVTLVTARVNFRVNGERNTYLDCSRS